jgi:hypothetical protein
MDIDRLKKSLDGVLRDVGVARVVNRELSQVLDMGDGIFVEVVLNEASKQEAVENAVKSLAERQKKEGQEIDFIVRSVWKVKSVEKSAAISVKGVMKAAIPFTAQLVSGRRSKSVPVWMTFAAREFLATRPLVPELPESDLMKVAVKEYLEEQLRLGGESYWDPLKYPVADLNEAAMLFLSGYRPEFYQLKWAVDDYIDTVNNERQLKSLVTRRVKLFDFENGLSELSTQLGGAIAAGSSTPTNARELFQALDNRERGAIEFYYRRKMRDLSAERKAAFPSLFTDPDGPASD